jgi:hypothetical protein
VLETRFLEETGFLADATKQCIDPSSVLTNKQPPATASEWALPVTGADHNNLPSAAENAATFPSPPAKRTSAAAISAKGYSAEAAASGPPIGLPAESSRASNVAGARPCGTISPPSVRCM